MYFTFKSLDGLLVILCREIDFHTTEYRVRFQNMLVPTSNMFDAGMPTMLAQRHVSIV